MGTQQILMIVLSVIIVGAAVAVGIQMFDTQATNSQRTAIAADIQNFGAQVLAFQRTPTSMGGGKGENLTSAAVKANLAQYLGFTTDNTLENVNAVYTLLSVNDNIATITGVKDKITAKGEIDVNKEADDAITIEFSTTD